MGEWIEHTGDGCPYPRGTLVDIEQRNGEVVIGVSAMNSLVSADGSWSTHNGPMDPSCSNWHWTGEMPDLYIVKHRLHDDGTAEQATRAARISNFMKIGHKDLGADKPVPLRLPEKERAE